MEQKLTVEQVLEMTVNMLGRITVPVAMIESIGTPVAQAINNINGCLEAFKRQEQEAQETEQNGEQPDDGNVIELVPEE